MELLDGGAGGVVDLTHWHETARKSSSKTTEAWQSSDKSSASSQSWVRFAGWPSRSRNPTSWHR
jgi:hypothetical protein